MRSKDKKVIIKKYSGQITNLVEKLHCIMIYYCIKDFLVDVREIKICRDVNFRVLKNLLPLLFKENNYLKEIKVIPRKEEEPESKAHKFALRTFRRRKHATKIITKKMVEDILFEFKE